MTNESSLREVLQEATGAMHRSLDLQFEEFDLATLAGYECFLQAHSIAANTYDAPLSEFCLEQLNCQSPSLKSAIALDLKEIGQPAWEGRSAAPAIGLKTPYQTAGMAYVVLGSRLGTAHLANEYAGKIKALRPDLNLHFMTDRGGLSCWRSFIAWQKEAVLSAHQVDEAVESAGETFALFADAARQVSKNLQPASVG